MEINPNFSENAIKDFYIIEEAKQGNQKAFTQLMNHYKDSVFYMVNKMLNNPDDASDVTQLTFSKAFENLEKYKPDFAFSTWLFKIATNNAIDFLRKRKQNTISLETFYKAEDKTLEIPSNTLTPEEVAIKKQQITILKDVINQLPEYYLILIELRYYSEKSYDEIADELQIPIGTVKARLFRAKGLLADILNRRKKNTNSDF
ncbi:MAG: sigma-70 family RNA polymerase sigma factor [Sphingobacteriales bacterium]|nr:MAG: sigma-70 family RNA polymerase sigma factor [Sphingobacteriales bacterium]